MGDIGEISNNNCKKHKATQSLDLNFLRGAEDSNLQALQFQQMAVRRKLPGGAGICHFGPHQGFIEG
jgi:hypothetical protein